MRPLFVFSGGGAGTMMEQVPGENVVGGGISSGRGQRYSIDYTTLTEMDRMRVMQQVNSLRQRLVIGIVIFYKTNLKIKTLTPFVF